MRIETTKTELGIRDISSIVLSHMADVEHKRKLMRYYMGDHDIRHKLQRNTSAPNNKLVSNYCEYITNMSTGFFMGMPVSYTSASDNEDSLGELVAVLNYNDEASHNLRLAEEASIKGEAYELLYMDADAQIRFAMIPAEEIVLVCDASVEKRIMYAVRHYRVYDIGRVTYKEYVEVYDRSSVTSYSYNGGSLTVIDGPKPHYFDDVPIVEYPNNEQRRGDFEGVISLVDAYNKAQSLTLDDMEDFTNAYLVLKGLGGNTAEDMAELRQNKVLQLDEGGNAEWLIKDLNDDYIENIKKRLQSDIHKFSNIPDMTDDSFSGNTSGVAIKYKLIGLEQVRSRKERGFKQGLQRRIELISGMVRTKSGPAIDFRDVQIIFTANIPANVQDQANLVKTLYGIVSLKTLLGQLSFVDNPASEIEEARREQGIGDDYADLGMNAEGGADGAGIK
ncbi:MAG: phage portal protein [Anaerovibrio sp.]|uniref:phage portal protein n=1 Tax=Anaerovibrio sp. TaxID=1872532 RepID=UPI002E7A0546|nr:phage portal protein [Anaerovibrio sp.]MEE1307926.1 phage portal protein [Anaerovibrio sp.]